MARAKIYRVIKQYLLELIAQNRGKPNFMLPSEQQICIKFGCSRVPAKRALNELSDEGLITRIAGKGSFINKKVTSDEKRFFKKNICVVMPEINTEFNREVINGINDCLAENGAALFCFLVNDKETQEKIAIESTFRLFFDGLIMFPGLLKTLDTKFSKLIKDKNDYPLMFVAGEPDDIFASSVKNNSTFIKDILTSLVEKGHKKIGFVCDPRQYGKVYANRIEEYKLFMKTIGEPALICEVDHQDKLGKRDKATENIAELFKQNIDISALITVNFALDYLSSCKHFYASSVTKESLIIIDRPEKGAALPFREVTYLDKEPYQMGRIAAEKLLYQIDHLTTPEKIFITPKLSKHSK